MLCTGSCETVTQVLLNGIILRQCLREYRAEQEKQHDYHAKYGSAVAQETPNNFFRLTMPANGYGILRQGSILFGR